MKHVSPALRSRSCACAVGVDHSTHSGSVHWLDSAQWALPAYTGTGSKSPVSKLAVQ